MSTTQDRGNCATAEPIATKEHLVISDKETLIEACNKFLQLRSHMESLDHELNSLGQQLGLLNLAIANHIGPQEHPIVLKTSGIPLVINVAENLHQSGRVTATITEAVNAEDVIDYAEVA